MDVVERISRLLGEDYVSDQRAKMLAGLNKQLEHERKRQKTLKTPEEREKGRKRIEGILSDIEKVHQGAREDRKKAKKGEK